MATASTTADGRTGRLAQPVSASADSVQTVRATMDTTAPQVNTIQSTLVPGFGSSTRTNPKGKNLEGATASAAPSKDPTVMGMMARHTESART